MRSKLEMQVAAIREVAMGFARDLGERLPIEIDTDGAEEFMAEAARVAGIAHDCAARLEQEAKALR